MIEFRTIGRHLVLLYTPDLNADRVNREFAEKKAITLRKTFTFRQQDQYELPADPSYGDDADPLDGQYAFRLGKLVRGYFKLNRDVIETSRNFYFCKDLELRPQMFTAVRNISILKKTDSLVRQDVYIGEDKGGSIPEDAYQELIDNFPNSYELDRHPCFIASSPAESCCRAKLPLPLIASVGANRKWIRRFEIWRRG